MLDKIKLHKVNSFANESLNEQIDNFDPNASNSLLMNIGNNMNKYDSSIMDSDPSILNGMSYQSQSKHENKVIDSFTSNGPINNDSNNTSNINQYMEESYGNSKKKKQKRIIEDEDDELISNLYKNN